MISGSLKWGKKVLINVNPKLNIFNKTELLYSAEKEPQFQINIYI